VRLVDLSCDVAGRFAAKLFAMAGWEVVRPIEERSGGIQDGLLTTYLDAHKTILPRFSPNDLDELLAGAELIFTSFDRGHWQGFAGLAMKLPQACSRITTSTYGTTGLYASWRGGPLAEWAAGGYFAITGEPDREPLIGPETLCGYVAGYTAAIAAEAALRLSRRTGSGCEVDISTMEAMLCVHQSTFSRVAAGLGRQRTGRYTETYPLVVRPCADGYVSLGVVTDEEFDRLAIAFGRPDLPMDERFATARARGANRDALDEELARFLIRHSAEEVVAILEEHAIAAGKVADCLELIDNPQLAYRAYWERTRDGAMMPGNPIPAARPFGGAPAAGTVGDREGALPLTGTVVLDFTAFWAGPSATRCLADLGATVIKVERPGSRVDLDDQLDDPAAVVQHLYHCKMNRHKRSLVVDLGSLEGQQAVLRLARKADVVVENFRPGVADRLGIGAEALGAANPYLVYVSLSGFGSAGPWAGKGSYGPTIEATSSIEARTGYCGGEPLRLGHTLPDGVGGLAGALAAMRGLRERDEQGRGGWVDVSQLEAYAAISGEEILAASRLRASPPRIGNRSRGGAIQGAFPCRGDDEWIAMRLTDGDDVQCFAELAEMPKLEELAVCDPRDDDAIERLIANYSTNWDKRELARLLQGAGLEAFAILKPEDLLADTHLADRGFFVKVEAGERVIPLPGTPFRSEPRLANADGQAPRFGEHTTAIMAAKDVPNRSEIAKAR
jgi:crotonobetainyl-CoA:carnitine CoA-transferase CaiB-like acyl-CoA transferase